MKRTKIIFKRHSNLRLKLELWCDDHPILFSTTVLFMLFMIGVTGWAIGGAKTPSLKYLNEAYNVQHLEWFGGKQAKRGDTNIGSPRIFMEIEDFDDKNIYNRYDIMATDITDMKDYYRKIIKRENFIVRILILDPRLFENKEYCDVAKYWKRTCRELLAIAWSSVTILASLKQEFEKKYPKNRFQVRLYNDKHHTAIKEHFIPGRYYHKYNDDPKSRKHFDIIVPYCTENNELNPIAECEYLKNISDFVSYSYFIIKDTPNDELVKKYSKAFEALWTQSVSLQEILNTFTLKPELIK